MMLLNVTGKQYKDNLSFLAKIDQCCVENCGRDANRANDMRTRYWDLYDLIPIIL